MASMQKVIREADIVKEAMTSSHVVQSLSPALLVGTATAIFLYARTILRNPFMLK